MECRSRTWNWLAFVYFLWWPGLAQDDVQEGWLTWEEWQWQQDADFFDVAKTSLGVRSQTDSAGLAKHWDGQGLLRWPNMEGRVRWRNEEGAQRLQSWSWQGEYHEALCGLGNFKANAVIPLSQGKSLDGGFILNGNMLSALLHKDSLYAVGLGHKGSWIHLWGTSQGVFAGSAMGQWQTMQIALWKTQKAKGGLVEWPIHSLGGNWRAQHNLHWNNALGNPLPLRLDSRQKSSLWWQKHRVVHSTGLVTFQQILETWATPYSTNWQVTGQVKQQRKHAALALSLRRRESGDVIGRIQSGFGLGQRDSLSAIWNAQMEPTRSPQLTNVRLRWQSSLGPAQTVWAETTTPTQQASASHTTPVKIGTRIAIGHWHWDVLHSLQINKTPFAILAQTTTWSVQATW